MLRGLVGFDVVWRKWHNSVQVLVGVTLVVAPLSHK